MKRNNCKCGSDNTTLKSANPCDFGFIVCNDCGNKSKSREFVLTGFNSHRDIIKQWNEDNPPEEEG